jgi:VIT1/CCC1 family predicted Fe2+/Mn2+ transporter
MHPHIHRTGRSGWLRAGVLGANDGVLSISSLLLGVAAANMGPNVIVITGFAGLVAGALSMAAGEYVSVSSQADTERADLDIERHALQHDFEAERAELREIYVRRGLDRKLAAEVARQLMDHDALGAHARDEIGITDTLSARPLQAALTSMASFVIGGVVPLLMALLVPTQMRIPVIAGVSLSVLAILGAAAARAGGAPIWRGAVRVLMWGGMAMGVTGIIGTLFNTVG